MAPQVSTAATTRPSASMAKRLRSGRRKHARMRNERCTLATSHPVFLGQFVRLPRSKSMARETVALTGGRGPGTSRIRADCGGDSSESRRRSVQARPTGQLGTLGLGGICAQLRVELRELAAGVCQHHLTTSRWRRGGGMAARSAAIFRTGGGGRDPLKDLVTGLGEGQVLDDGVEARSGWPAAHWPRWC